MRLFLQLQLIKNKATVFTIKTGSTKLNIEVPMIYHDYYHSIFLLTVTVKMSKTRGLDRLELW
jgi:fumarate hydratase class II